MHELIIIISLVLIVIAQNVLHCIERKDLYSRIMSKDLTEYGNIVDNKDKQKNMPKNRMKKVMEDYTKTKHL